MNNRIVVKPPIIWSKIANFCLVALIGLIIAWEMWLAPLRPGGTWLVIKCIPLIWILPKVFKRDIYVMQWSTLLIWLYFIEGVVRGYSDFSKLSEQLAWIEIILCMGYFIAVLFYLRPIKKAAKLATKNALEKARIKAQNLDS